MAATTARTRRIALRSLSGGGDSTGRSLRRAPASLLPPFSLASSIVAGCYYSVVPVARPPSLLAYPSYVATQVTKAAQRCLLDAFGEHDLRGAHVAVLAALADLGPLSQQELADSLDIDKSHMVGFVDDLDARGLVRRDKDPSDRRRHQVRLTSAGQKLLPRLLAAAARSDDRLFAVLTEAERATLKTLLQRVLEACDTARRSGGTADPQDTT
jgi:DNA-binding MarR family transcriptional regulator